MSATPSLSLIATASERGRFENECVHLFGEFAQSLGLPRSAGQIYGLLFSSSHPLSFSDIVTRLEISKGSASQGLQLLRSLAAINLAKAKIPLAIASEKAKTSDTGRREYFEPELSLRQLVSGVLRERVAPLAVTGADRLKTLRLLAQQERNETKFYLDRVKQLETWRRRFNTVLPLLSVLLGPKKNKR